jgi:PAS domain S-box-containing protein
MVIEHQTAGSFSEGSRSTFMEHVCITLMETLPVGLSLVDNNGIIMEFNPAAEQITGYSRAEVLGKSHLEIMHGSSDPKACPLFQYVLLRKSNVIAT